MCIQKSPTSSDACPGATNLKAEVEDLLGDLEDKDFNMEDILMDQAIGVVENEHEDQSAAVQKQDAAQQGVAGQAAEAVESAESDNSRIGNSIRVKGKTVGTIRYLLHWEPPSFSAQCKIHEGCYCTADINKVDESELEHWLVQGPRYVSAEAHLATKPAASYNMRRRKG